MGLLELIIGTFGHLFNAIRFLIRLSRGDRDAWQLLYLFLRGPTKEGRARCKASSHLAKSKYRPTRVVNIDGTTRLSERGELGGSLYSTWATPLKSIGEFGIGIGLFFEVIAGYFFLLFLMFLAAIPSAKYFFEQEYSDFQPDVKIYLKGSAVCTRKQTIHFLDHISGDNVTRTMNMCPLTRMQGVLNLSSIACFAALVLLFWRRIMNRMTIVDEDRQTAQDYSVCVSDPGRDDRDPKEWFDYFSQFGEVASITVALDNGELLRALAAAKGHEVADLQCEGTYAAEAALRREAAEKARPGEKAASLSLSSRALTTAGTFMNEVVLGIKSDRKLHDERIATQAAIRVACHKHYPVSAIFCIFEKEAGQRACLSQLSNGLWAAVIDDHASLPERFRWRGTNVLSVHEAPEPTEIMWAKLCVRSNTEVCLRSLVSNGAVAGACWLSVTFIGIVSMVDSPLTIYYVATTVSVLSSLVPQFIDMAVETETHLSMSSLERSIMIKTFVFEICTSSLAIFLFTPFAMTLDPAYLDQVCRPHCHMMLRTRACTRSATYVHVFHLGVFCVCGCVS